jgi:SET domain-containing protein
MKKSIKGYSPLPKKVIIGKSKIHGIGIIASEKIDKGVDLGVTHIKDSRFKDGLIRTPLGGFLNHSFTLNCEYAESDDILSLVTKQAIEKSEEVTVDYTPYYSIDEVAKYK